MKTVSEVQSELNLYIAMNGGILSIREADEEFNDYARKTVKAMKNEYGAAYLANTSKAGTDADYKYVPYNGQTIFTAEYDICSPVSDEKLLMMIYSWANGLNDISIDEIHNYLKKIGGCTLLWR